MDSIVYSFLSVRKEKINKSTNHKLKATQRREEEREGEKEEEKEGRAGEREKLYFLLKFINKLGGAPKKCSYIKLLTLTREGNFSSL